MGVVCDLHTHTNHSDGIYSPSEIVDMAEKCRLKAVAITDHDSVTGLREIMEKKHPIEVIPGIELSTEIEGNDTHIIGLYIDYKNVCLNEVLDQCRKVRHERGYQIVENLIKANVKITFDQVKKCAGIGVIGRMHIAKVLHDNGLVSTIQDAFRVYLGDESPFYVPKFKITPKDAFKLIRDAGGICVWAHPGCEDIDHLLKQFVEDGLQGIEVWHPKHTNAQVRHYCELAKFYKLVMSGGSDYHGHKSYSLGDHGLDDEYFLKLKNFRCTSSDT